MVSKLIVTSIMVAPLVAALGFFWSIATAAGL